MSILQEASKWELIALKDAYQNMVDELISGVVVSENTISYYKEGLIDIENELNKRK